MRELPSLPSVELQAAISSSLDEEGVIIRVVVVANMRTLVSCLFHIHFYHIPPAPASLHPCPLAGSSPTLAGEQKPAHPRANTSATRWARWNKQTWGAFSALATLASLLSCDPTEHCGIPLWGLGPGHCLCLGHSSLGEYATFLRLPQASA